MDEVIFSHDAFQDAQYGGTARYVLELRSGLMRRGISARVGISLHSNGLLRDLGLGRYAGPPVPRRAMKAATRAAGELTERLVLRRAGPAIVYHKTWFGSFPPQRPRRAAVAVTVYDMIHEIFPEDFGPDDRAAERKRAWCEAADVIFTISQTTRRDLIALLDVPESKVFVTPLGVRPFSSPGTPHPGHSAADFLLFVGSRLRHYKGFDVLLKAMSAIDPAVNLVCFGGGPLTPQELAAIDSAGLVGRITQASGSDAILGNLYLRARALVYPSRYEGFGLPPLEAMSLGCPVIAAASPAVLEIAGAAAVTVPPGDAAALAEGVDAVLRSPELQATLSTLGRARSALFDWDSTVDGTVKGYTAALSSL